MMKGGALALTGLILQATAAEVTSQLPRPDGKPAEIKEIKAYCLDFNWDKGFFAEPGTWAASDPIEHVAWYKAIGANVIQTFAVSWNGYAWYKNGFVPEQPGLKHDFLPEVVKLGHKEGMLVFGYFCISSNPKWAKDHPDQSYGMPANYDTRHHIPYTDEYLTYLSASISDAVKKTGIDGFMIDWLWQPSRKATKGQWLECEKKLYTQLMGEAFPAEGKPSKEKLLAYNRKAIDRCWKTIRKAAKEANPNCLVWLSSNNIKHPDVINSDMYKEIDWLMNEAGDQKGIEEVRAMVGPHTRLVNCLAEWNGQDAAKVVPEALKAGLGLYGFTRPRNDVGLVPLEKILTTPISELKGDDRSIAVLARAYRGKPAEPPTQTESKGRVMKAALLADQASTPVKHTALLSSSSPVFREGAENKGAFVNSPEFANPPAEYRPHHMNHEFTSPRTRDKWTPEMLAAMNAKVELGNTPPAGAFATLDQLLANQAGGTVINVAWTERWIEDPGNIHNLGQAARLLASKGLRVWLYDEYFYPSGWAKGLAVQGQPENQARNLAFITQKGSGSKQLSFPLPADGIRFEYAVFYPDNRTTDGSKAIPVPVQESSLTLQSPGGDWTLYVFYVQKHNVGHGHYQTYDKLPGGGRGYLNFLNRAAVARYLEVELQPLSTGIAGFHGMFDGLFIDEPSLMSFYSSTPKGGRGFSAVPYGNELFPEFKKLHGYDLQPYLPCLFEGADEGARTVRVQFYRTIASLMDRNFMGQVANWCHTNGIRFSGHFLLEEFLTDHVGYYGDLMKIIARMEYPGCDVLSRRPETYLKDEYLGTKYVSSAARGAGRERVMVEICPVRGDNTLFSKNPCDGFMSLMTHVFLHGADHLNLYGYGMVKSAVDQQRMNRYCGRIAWLLRTSVHAAEVAVYNPIADVQAAMRPRSSHLPSLDPEASAKDAQVDALAKVLLKNQVDFNFVTEDLVLGGTISDGQMAIAAQKYRVIILPGLRVIPLAVLQKLDAFQKSGGVVLYTDRTPEMGIAAAEHAAVRNLVQKHNPFVYLQIPGKSLATDPVGKFVHDLKQHLKEALVIGGPGASAVFAAQFRRGDNPLYYLINSTGTDTTFTCDQSAHGKGTLINFETGTSQDVTLPVQIQLPAHRGMALLVDAASGKAASVICPKIADHGKPPAETKEARDARMGWWRDARFGMFVVVGPYSGLAGTWEGKPVATNGCMEWIQEMVNADTETYAKAALPLFKPKPGAARAWAKLAKTAGCRYIVFTTKFCDGFAMFDSKVSDFDAGSVLQRDIVKEYVDACRAEGLRVGFYHSVIDWHHDQYEYRRSKLLPHPLKGKPYPNGPRDHSKYIDYLHAQVNELMSNYGQVDVLWFDYSAPEFQGQEAWRAFDLMRMIREKQPNIIINNRLFRSEEAGWNMQTGAGGNKLDTTYGDFITPEQYIPATGMPGVDWETCMTMNTTWGYSDHDHAWKTPEALLRKLIDIAGKGGNFLLNIGPKGDGSIPQPSIESMEVIGRWMKVNSEAIYGTSATIFGAELGKPVQGKTGDGKETLVSSADEWRCTTKPGKIYLHLFKWPADGTFDVPSVKGKVTRAYLLADRKELKVEQSTKGVTLSLPAEAPDKIASVICLEIADPGARLVESTSRGARGL
jgi:alpha-L-fucosidase